MAQPRRQIFRESAMQQYVQRREQDILPQIVSPPVFAGSWFLLALVLMAGLLAWSAQLPTYQSASGIITKQGQLPSSTSSNVQALIFFPSTDDSQLHVGLPIKLQIGSTGPSLSSTITSIEADIISPSDARQRFQLDTGEAQVITEPSRIVIVNLGKSVSASTFAGSTITAQIQVGTHSVLSQLS